MVQLPKMRIYILALIILFSLSYVTAYVSDNPIDCEPNNPDIFPGQIEICNDNIDNNCNINNGHKFDDDSSTGVDENDISCCNLLDAKWILNNAETFSTNDGTAITLRVQGTFACGSPESKTIAFEIWEDELFFDDKVNYISNNYFSNNLAEVTWTAEWIDDGFLQGNPEYYFIATLAGTGPQYPITSSKILDIQSENLIVTEASPECGDGNLDQSETCLSCPSDAGCGINQKGCDINGIPTCIPFDQQCNTPITPNDCSNNLCCFPGNICKVVNGNPTCGCNTISDNVCSSDPSCSSIDPDCCEIDQAYWSKSCAGNGQPVDLIIKTTPSCNNLEASFDIKEDDGILSEEDISPDPPNKIIENNEARTRWDAIYQTDIFGRPEFFFYSDIPSISNLQSVRSKAPDLEVRPCEISIDSDCDGVPDAEDLCTNTEYCANTDNDGCTQGQTTCLGNWDCSGVEWIDHCEESGIRTRDVEQCIYLGAQRNNPSDPCSFSSVLVSQQSCGEERPFPAFDISNVLLVIFILVIYYIYRKQHKNF